MKKLILLVATDSLLRLNCFNLLEAESFNIISAEDGLLALRLAKEFQPDLIIFGINTSHLDGYGIIKKLHDNLLTCKIPYIFMTSETEENSYHRTQPLGTNDYLKKPLQNNKLLAAIYSKFKKEVDLVQKEMNSLYS